MSTTSLNNCKCGSAAQPPVMKARKRWVITCSREGCPALVQATTKRDATNRWDNLST